MRYSHRRRRPGAVVLASLTAFALLAAGCSDKKDETDTGAGGVEATDTTTAGGAAETTDATAGGDAEETTTTAAAEVQAGGRLIIAGEAEVSNPWTPEKMQCDSFCQMRARTFFEPLVAVDADLQPQPFLAESVTPNDDSTVWTVTLRDGITFHDGTPFNADAAIRNLQQAGRGFLNSAQLKDVAKNPDGSFKIDKVDDLTFTIATGKDGDPAKPLPWPAFPLFLTSGWALMASPAWLDAAAADPNKETQPVGTGPFVFDSFTAGDNLVVKRNPDYWRQDEAGNPIPYLDEIEFRVIQDSQTRGQALEAGDVDMIATATGEVVADFRAQADEFPMVEQAELGETFYVLLNLTQPVLQDKRVRCGLLQAIDKQAVIDLTGGGIETPANGPFSPGQEGYLDDNGSLPYDPVAAKALIDDYVAETGQKPKIIYSAVNSSTALTTAQYYQQVWQDIGVDVEVKQIEQSKLITNALFGDPAFHAFGWRNHAGIVSDQQYFWWHGSAALPPGELALNFGRLNDPVINDLLEKSRSEADPEVRQGYAEDINRRFAEECWILPTSYAIWGIPHSKAVQNIGSYPLPDGGTARDGAGFPGQVWLGTVWKQG